jgi:hypothetical protein
MRLGCKEERKECTFEEHNSCHQEEEVRQRKPSTLPSHKNNEMCKIKFTDPIRKI